MGQVESLWRHHYDYTPLTAREFRYDNPRARYIALDYNTGGDPDQTTWTLAGNPLMTDYAGVTPWGDFELSYSSGSYQTSEQRRYLDGECHETTGGSPAQAYWHGDLIASTFATSDSGGGLADTMAYTAFGERVNLGDGSPPASFPRYEYAGGFGYEAGIIALTGANSNLAAMTLQHLGARWYDSALGRFVQRDPLGLFARLNVYGYCDQDPVAWADPSGEKPPRLRRQGPPVRIGDHILQHWEVETRDDRWSPWRRKTWKYSHTTKYPANGGGNDKTGNALADDAVECINNINNDKVDGVSQGVEGVDEGSRIIQDTLGKPRRFRLPSGRGM